MKRYIVIIVISIIILAIFLSGCTQENNKEFEENSYGIELLWHRLDEGGTPPNDFKEVNGELINNGTRDYEKVVITVDFLNKNDKVIYSGNYTVYDFLHNYTANFFVTYFSTYPNYEQYDHYAINVKLR